MVFNMLKGIRRLMLTTGLICGVGLFLCGNTVLAEPTIDSSKKPYLDVTSQSGSGTGDGKLVVRFTSYDGLIPSETLEGYRIIGAKIVVDDKTVLDIVAGEGTDSSPILSFVNSPASNKTVAEVSEKTLLNKSMEKGISVNSSTNFKIKYDIAYKANSSEYSIGETTSSSFYSFTSTLYSIQPVVSKSNYDTAKDSATFKVTVGGRIYDNVGYGFKDEEYSVSSANVLDSAYYENYYISGDAPKWYEADKFKPAGTVPFSGKIETSNIEPKVQYFPKLKKVSYSYSKGTNVYLDSAGKATTSLAISIETVDGDAKNVSVIKQNMDFSPVVNANVSNSNIRNTTGDYYKDRNNEEGVISFGNASGGALIDEKFIPTTANAIITPQILTANKTTPPINNNPEKGSLSLWVFAYPTGVTLLNESSVIVDQNTTITLKKGSSVSLTMMPQPLACDQTINKTVRYECDNDIVTVSHDPDNSKLILTGGSKSGKTKLKLLIPVNTVEGTNTYKEFSLEINNVENIAYDSAKTKEAIEKSEKNYITIGDDFKLDLKALIKDYACDSNGTKLNIEPQVVWISSGSDYGEINSDLKLKGKKTGTVKVCANFNSTNKDASTAELKDLEIGVYPMPTAKYLDSSRTIEVVLPQRVSKAYDDDNKISEVTGFKLTMEDSSGNTIYEYDSSKFKSATDGSASDGVKKYTVNASDVEGMVTSAASNGKFSSDTTSVKFKVIPMGYKPKKEDKERVTASDKINATCSATVYRLTASGTNFSTSYAYGLDGQTVKLTASPNSGFTFKQWSDGNTSNPREIKVSGSGTKAYTAVANQSVGTTNAGTGVNGLGGTGTANGTGVDNSQLYDDVPKTAESNSAIWLIIFMVFAVMGTTYALYLQLRAASSKHDK